MGELVKKPQALTAMLGEESVKSQFKNAIGKHSDAFIASIVSVTTSDSKLMQCEPKELVKEALKVATLNLRVDRTLGWAYIIPFQNSVRNPDGSFTKKMTPTMVIGYKGWIQLAIRSGEYKYINCGCLVEGQHMDMDELRGVGKVSGNKKSGGNVVGYFAHFETHAGYSHTLYMTTDEMAEYAKKYSKSIPRATTKEMLLAIANTPEGGEAKQEVGWMGDFHAMGKKTILLRLIRTWGIMSADMQVASKDDDIPEQDQNEVEDAVAEEIPVATEIPAKTDIQEPSF